MPCMGGVESTIGQTVLKFAHQVVLVHRRSRAAFGVVDLGREGLAIDHSFNAGRPDITAPCPFYFFVHMRRDLGRQPGNIGTRQRVCCKIAEANLSVHQCAGDGVANAELSLHHGRRRLPHGQRRADRLIGSGIDIGANFGNVFPVKPGCARSCNAASIAV